MQFITTDQRIAVENFEIGLIYTVTFTNGSYFLGACIGIGKDYVMFQRTEPELIFSLTMATAADVASIEPLSDDIGKIIEYTGSVPVSIKTDGSPLLDYLITGNTVQNGTPTPSSPVAVVGVGELDSGQYKIPISSAGQTTPIYLGETQTTRRIKKLVLTGTETIDTLTVTDQLLFRFNTFYTNDKLIGNAVDTLLCNVYKIVNGRAAAALAENNYSMTTYNSNTDNRLIVHDDRFTTVEDFKAYLAQQYAAGTPVCVWYVLATPETAVINEPLMRIGDYADTLSYRQSGINIPTADGLNVFDVSTTIKPSEVYLKYFSPLL